MSFWSSLVPLAATGAGFAVGGPVGAAAGGAVGGAFAGSEKYKRQKQIEDQSKAIRAAEIRSSPWTGRAPSTQVEYAGDQLGEMWGGGLAGGVSGASLGNSLSAGKDGWKGIFASKDSPEAGFAEMSKSAGVANTYKPTMIMAENQIPQSGMDSFSPSLGASYNYMPGKDVGAYQRLLRKSSF